jgi:hypothetical protein
MVGQLSVRDETPQAIGSTRHGWQVRDLLATCQEILDNVGDLPLVPMVLRRHGGTTALSPSSQMGSGVRWGSRGDRPSGRRFKQMAAWRT